MSDFWTQRGFDWLDNLSPEDDETLRGSSASREASRGEIIFSPDPAPGGVYLLERGRVRIFRISPDGTETTFGYVSPGEVFGELSAFGDDPRESFAQATERSLVWRVEKETFQTLIRSSPQLTLVITEQIGRRMKRMESRVENLVFRDARSRLARILLELAHDFGSEEAEQPVIDLRLTQAELATLVGCTRQTVNACLGELEEAGVVGRAGQRITILEPESIRKRAAQLVSD